MAFLELPAQQAGHHLDAGQRVLDLVGDRGRHLAEHGEPVAQALPFLELLDARQVLEEHRGADGEALGVADEGQRVAEHLVGRRQAEFGTIGQEREFVGTGEHPHDRGMRVEDFGERPPHVTFAGRQSEDATRLVVDQHERAATIDRQHAVPHVRDQVAEERVVDEMRGGDRRAMGRPLADGGHGGFGRTTRRHGLGGGHDSTHPPHTQLSCPSREWRASAFQT